MKKYAALFVVLFALAAGALAAETATYQNTVYLPYYRLPKPAGPSTYKLAQGRGDGAPFNFGSHDPEPLLAGRGPYRASDATPIERYLLAALGSGRITQINYFRLAPSESGDGSLDFSNFYPQHMEYLHKLRQIYGVRLALCVAGGSQNFLPTVKSEVSRQKLARNIIAVAKTWELDAVDFDWEYPRQREDMQAYVTLITAVRHGLQQLGADKKVSVAVSRKQAALSSQLFRAVDMVNFMSYDFALRHSTLEDSKEMVAYLRARYAIPSGKIFLGLPFYGKEIKSGKRQAKAYGLLAQDFVLAPQDNEVDNYYFNGRAMVRQKFKFAREQNLGGIMVWELGQDSKDQRSLLKTLPRQR